LKSANHIFERFWVVPITIISSDNIIESSETENVSRIYTKVFFTKTGDKMVIVIRHAVKKLITQINTIKNIHTEFIINNYFYISPYIFIISLDDILHYVI